MKSKEGQTTSKVNDANSTALYSEWIFVQRNQRRQIKPTTCNTVNSTDDSAEEGGDKDHGGSSRFQSAVKSDMLSSRGARQTGTTNGGKVNAANPNLRSTGSRFLHLKDTEDLGGADMETEEGMIGEQDVNANGWAKESSSKMGKVKPSNEMESANDLASKFVLRASHPSLVEGSRQVLRGKVDESKNPNRQGMQKRTKEKVLRDVTNKLEAGPISFKLTWSGP